MTDLADLRESTNETARMARGSLRRVLVVCAVLGFLLSGTDDMALLMRSDVVVPYLEVTVPVEQVFELGPVLLVLLHLDLLVRLDWLHGVSQRLRERIEAEREPEGRATEIALLLPFHFLRLQFHGMAREPSVPDRNPGGGAESRQRQSKWRESLKERMKREREEGGLVVLVVLVAVPAFALPIIVLMAIQMRFLPYQSETLTLVHQACVSADLLIQFVFAFRLVPVRRFMSKAIAGGWPERAGVATCCVYAALYFVLCLTFSLCVAVVPGSWLERHRPFLPDELGVVTGLVFRDWWEDDGCSYARFWEPSFPRRYLHVGGATVAAGRRDGEIVAAFLSKGEDPDLAWRFVDRLDLGGRSFRYARFDGSEFRQASFRGSDLRCARFSRARLRGTDLEWARAQGAEFGFADLTGARLERGNFEGATFRRARLDGADAAGATFTGASLREASLHGTALSGALFRATDLRDAELHGADLANAVILGSNANRAGFHGAHLTGATVEGTTLRKAGFHGTDMQAVTLELADLTGSTWESPQGRARIRQETEAGQGIRTGEPQGTLSKPLPGAAVTAEGDGAVVDALVGHTRCVWTDGRGPFAGWSAPVRACREELERRRVDMACGNGRAAEAMGVAGVLMPAESWLDVGGIVALLERDPNECGAIDADIRRDLCSELLIWYREQRFGDAVEGGDFWRQVYAGRAASRDDVAESGVCADP